MAKLDIRADTRIAAVILLVLDTPPPQVEWLQSSAEHAEWACARVPAGGPVAKTTNAAGSILALLTRRATLPRGESLGWLVSLSVSHKKAQKAQNVENLFELFVLLVAYRIRPDG